MPRISITRGVSISSREAALNVAKIRSEIPVRQYLEVCHSAAMTGKLARFSHGPDGKLILSGQFDDLDPDQRIDLMRYLTNKALPDARELDPLLVAASGRDDLDANGRAILDAAAERIGSLSVEDLRRLAGSAAATPVPPSASASASAPDGPIRAG
jgi:hypothetical protein